MVEGITSPMVHADEKRLAAERKKVLTEVLHRVAEVARRRCGGHRVGRLRLKAFDADPTRENQLFNVID